jgi:hypothetical protein
MKVAIDMPLSIRYRSKRMCRNKSNRREHMKVPNLILKSLVILTLVFFFSLASFAQEEKMEDRFDGNVIGMSGLAVGKTGRMTMIINHWTTDLETQKLYEILQEGGTLALLKAMRERTVGYISYTDTLRWPLNIARIFKLEDGRTLVRLVTNRPILFWEVAASTSRSRDYEFGWVEFTIDEEINKKGEGYLLHAAKIYINKDGKFSIDALGTNPHRLQNVKKSIQKKKK